MDEYSELQRKKYSVKSSYISKLILNMTDKNQVGGHKEAKDYKFGDDDSSLNRGSKFNFDHKVFNQLLRFTKCHQNKLVCQKQVGDQPEKGQQHEHERRYRLH